jgi:hypothetical protein
MNAINMDNASRIEFHTAKRRCWSEAGTRTQSRRVPKCTISGVRFVLHSSIYRSASNESICRRKKCCPRKRDVRSILLHANIVSGWVEIRGTAAPGRSLRPLAACSVMQYSNSGCVSRTLPAIRKRQAATKCRRRAMSNTADVAN